MNNDKIGSSVWVVYRDDESHYFKDENKAKDFYKYCCEDYDDEFDLKCHELVYSDDEVYTKQHCVRVKYMYATLVDSEDSYSSLYKHMRREYGLIDTEPTTENIEIQHLYGSKEYNSIAYGDHIDCESVSFVVDWDDVFVTDNANGMKEIIAHVKELVRKGVATYYTDSTGEKTTAVHRYRAPYDVNDVALDCVKRLAGDDETLDEIPLWSLPSSTKMVAHDTVCDISLLHSQFLKEDSN